jgi:hypothetical protein
MKGSCLSVLALTVMLILIAGTGYVRAASAAIVGGTRWFRMSISMSCRYNRVSNVFPGLDGSPTTDRFLVVLALYAAEIMPKRNSWKRPQCGNVGAGGGSERALAGSSS